MSPSLFFFLLLIATSSAFNHRLNDLPIEKCENGGELKEGECECTVDYKGERCKEEVCINGGKAHRNKEGMTICACPYGVEGEQCERPTHCMSGQGVMEDGKCKCERGFTGVRCEFKPCRNGVPVDNEDEVASCVCDKGYIGFFCGEELICEHGGSVNDNNECECVNGWRGDRCGVCDHHIEGDKCEPEISGNSVVVSTPLVEWPVVVAAVCAVVLMIVLILAVAFAVKNCKSKPSRVSSAQGSAIIPPEGTDV